MTDTAEQLADTIPNLQRSADLQALGVWLERQGLTWEEIKLGAGPRSRRPTHLVEARRLVAEFLRGQGWSYPAIGSLLGYAEHTAVLYLLRSRRAS